jgi:hypothetical protein
MVFTDILRINHRWQPPAPKLINDVRDFLPDTLDVTDLGLNTEFALCANFPRYFLHLGGENGELVNHVVDCVDEF